MLSGDVLLWPIARLQQDIGKNGERDPSLRFSHVSLTKSRKTGISWFGSSGWFCKALQTLIVKLRDCLDCKLQSRRKSWIFRILDFAESRNAMVTNWYSWSSHMCFPRTSREAMSSILIWIQLLEQEREKRISFCDSVSSAKPVAKKECSSLLRAAIIPAEEVAFVIFKTCAVSLCNSESRITSGFTGHEQESNHFAPARMSAPCASHCYHAVFGSRQ